MKTLKKLMALTLAIAMLAALAINATAAEAKITLTGEPGQYKDTHTYLIYQIFTGDVVVKSDGTDPTKTVKELQNVKYGQNYGDTGASVPKEVLDAITNARDFGTALVNSAGTAAGLKGNPIATMQGSNPTATVPTTGYYLIVDSISGELANLGTPSSGDVFSQYIVQVLGDVTIATKKDVTSTSKVINSDAHPTSEDATQNPGVSSDKKTDNVSIGDDVSFTIISHIPAHATDYDFFYFIMNDTLSKGLTFKQIDSVKYGANSDGSNATVMPDTDYATYLKSNNATSDNHTFEIALLNANSDGYAGKYVSVTYTATLNSDANIGSDGNLNTANTTYSNNPNENYDGTQSDGQPGKPDSTKDVPTGTTPDETTRTFTSGIHLQKVDQDGNALLGAAFTIEGNSINQVVRNVEAFVQSDGGTYYKLKTGSFTETAPQTTDKMVEAAAGATAGYVVDASYDGNDKVVVNDTTYRPYKDSDAGTTVYTLVKANADLYATTTPDYVKTTTKEVITSTNHVSQEVYVNSDGTLDFKGLGAGTYTIKETKVPDGYNKANDTVVEISFDNATQTFKVNGNDITAATDYLFPVTVQNIAGNVLPETGGIGTKIFYALGAVLVIGAGVVLVSRKRAFE